MDRVACFTPAFREFLDGQMEVSHQEQTRQRFRQEDGSYKYAASEWKDILKPSYTEQLVPQTLTEEDVHNDRWPVALSIITLKNGKRIETFVMHSRMFHGQNLTLDFMGVREVTSQKPVDELCWTTAEINDYLPKVGGNRRTVKALEVPEPNPIGA